MIISFSPGSVNLIVYNLKSNCFIGTITKFVRSKLEKGFRTKFVRKK
jgi:hypothetical protein